MQKICACILSGTNYPNHSHRKGKERETWCVWVCVCEREREKGRENKQTEHCEQKVEQF